MTIKPVTSGVSGLSVYSSDASQTKQTTAQNQSQAVAQDDAASVRLKVVNQDTANAQDNTDRGLAP